ncbi:hypothetical protein DL96DRAFT_1720127 [Flagelloscypha sp. PMI_526]|nr:hypothetical protein DL96DRAFT_1720127 [Flagelloscypha sp. PMI_526]
MATLKGDANSMANQLPEDFVLKHTVEFSDHELGTLAHEVTRVSLEVGTEEKPDSQAGVDRERGEWLSIGYVMADNPTNPVRSIATVTNGIEVNVKKKCRNKGMWMFKELVGHGSG